MDFRLRRLVLAVDLHPASACPAAVLSVGRRLLPASSLSSVFPFLSSLSPVLTSSALRGLPPSSFDLPAATLAVLSRALRHPLRPPPSPPRAALVAQSLFHLASDCPWDDEDAADDHLPGNLLLVLSPLPTTPAALEAFAGAGKAGPLLGKAFEAVRRTLASRRVRVCWVDVDSDGGRGAPEVVAGIRALGWGVCSAGEITLGSKVVPFGMIYPRISGTSEKRASMKIAAADLILEIADVSGEPLQCRCCTLEVFDAGPDREKPSFPNAWGELGGCGGVRISVKGVGKTEELEGMPGSICGVAILQGLPEKKKKEDALGGDGFFGDTVIGLLCGNKDLAVENPVWQLVLIFLYRRGFSALVSISRDGEEGSLVGMIKPFTVNSAILCIFDANHSSVDLPANNGGYCEDALKDAADKNRKVERRKLNRLCNLSWKAFRQSVFSGKDDDGGPDIELEEVYLVKNCKNVKKLRFLQCWLKQVKKHVVSFSSKPDESISLPDTQEGTEDATGGSQQETDVPYSSCSLREIEISQSMNEEQSLPASVEHLESFVGSLPAKIHNGLGSEAVDLGDLAERLVELATRASYVTFQRTMEERQGVESMSTDVSHDLKVVSEVSKVLLVKPRDLAAKYKDSISAAPEPDVNSSDFSTKKKIREHELQILFRMEILRSSTGTSIDENMKAKMVKDICFLLENIEFNLQGGLFSGESLIDFVERTIKRRYIHSLGDIIHRIYSQMEFLSFHAGEEDSISAHSGNHNHGTQDRQENNISRAFTEEENEKHLAQDVKSLLARTVSADNSNIKQNCRTSKVDIQVKQALEKRERALRLNHSLQNLLRVWAPKHKKTGKSQVCYSTSGLERKRKASRKDIVLETPNIGKKHRHVQGTDSTQEDPEQDTGSSQLVSKALFSHWT